MTHSALAKHDPPVRLADDLAQLVRALASAPNLRSARVEELAIEDDYLRRPLRPEDFDFIELAAVREDTVTDLCSLALNRLLLCIHDGTARDRELAEAVRPRLTKLALAHLERDVGGRERAPSGDAELSARRRAELTVSTAGAGTSGAEDAQGMVWLQCYAALQGYALAIERARSCGLGFGALAPVAEQLVAQAVEASALCPRYGLRSELHAHWQFYLPTTLMNINLALAFARSAAVPALFAGALLYFAARMRGFCEVHLAPGDLPGSQRSFGSAFDAVWRAVERDLVARHGDAAALELQWGFARARRAQELNDRDVTEQVEWIRKMRAYRDLAESIDARIRRERIEIDRETFVEPREMCSTTHVHDDHRLVVIETGVMVFWAMPGMKLRLAPGEMTLVPRGRLHGSAIESDQSVYHQPIIPPAWLRHAR